MSSHFQCTACGKCCFGQLPLSIKDAFANADRFPLAFVWTPVQQSSRDFIQTAKLGITIRLPDRKELAVSIVPTSFIPKDVKCPALGEDNLCSIHSTKPLRCKAMPFYPYREERYQGELLHPRPGWACDVSENAPIVFADKRIVDRSDFDAELKDLTEQVPALRNYFDYMQKYQYSLVSSLSMASTKGKSANIVTSLSSFLTATRHPAAKQLAASQLPVLQKFAELTAKESKWKEFHLYYTTWSKEMAYLSQRS